jgi:hypothetical protein
MKRARRTALAVLTSAGMVTALASVGSVLRGALPGETVSDAIEIPLGLVGAIATFSVLVTAFFLVRRRPLRWVAAVSTVVGVAAGVWLWLGGQAGV